MFYWVMRNAVDKRLVSQVPDFRLFSREAVAAIRAFREQHRFMRGLIAWLGLKEVVVPFEQRARTAEVSKYSLTKMFRFAWAAIASFSGLPLRLSFGVGLLMTVGGLVYLCYVLYATLVAKSTVPGWSCLICVQIVFSGATLMALGLIGDYVARLYDEAKRRRLYVISSAINVAQAQATPARMILLRQAGAEVAGGLASETTPHETRDRGENSSSTRNAPLI